MTNKTLPLIVAMTSVMALAACSETTSNNPPPASTAPVAEMRTGSAQDEAACERAVSNATQNPDTVVLSSEFSEANTLVIVGVGNQQARWRCLVSGGIVAEVTSLTNEGTL